MSPRGWTDNSKMVKSSWTIHGSPRPRLAESRLFKVGRWWPNTPLGPIPYHSIHIYTILTIHSVCFTLFNKSPYSCISIKLNQVSIVQTYIIMITSQILPVKEWAKESGKECLPHLIPWSDGTNFQWMEPNTGSIP